jgi:hypothetical protein
MIANGKKMLESEKAKIIEEAKAVFFDKEFDTKLDSNVHLIGFNNGVYDLTSGKFRDGTHDDYISLSTQNDYRTFSNNMPHIKEILGFFNQILPNDINQLQLNISNYFFTNLKDLVFITYIQLGLLNRFEIDPNITDEKLLGNSESERKTNVKLLLNRKFKKDKEKYLSTYYFLTRDKYSNLEIYIKSKKIDWFEFLFENAEPWYYSFAMNWVSQINFYNHFINNRVLLVTGATGQGKSTEVPKLLYYALIAINLNFSARVVSTQPTIIPTVDKTQQVLYLCLCSDCNSGDPIPSERI